MNSVLEIISYSLEKYLEVKVVSDSDKEFDSDLAKHFKYDVFFPKYAGFPDKFPHKHFNKEDCKKAGKRIAADINKYCISQDIDNIMMLKIEGNPPFWFDHYVSEDNRIKMIYTQGRVFNMGDITKCGGMLEVLIHPA